MLLCVLCSHRPHIERLFLVIIFLGFVLGKLFRLCFVLIFCMYFVFPMALCPFIIIIIIITKIYRAPKTINTLRRYLQQLECIVIICKII